MSQHEKRPRPQDYFSDWKKREALAEAMIPVIGALYRRNILVFLYGRSLINISVLEIMQAHRFVRQVEGNELSEFETYPVLSALGGLADLGCAHVDIGRLAVLYEAEGAPGGASVEAFVREQVAGLVGKPTVPIERPRDIVLFGFGRIGRLVARNLVEQTGGGQVLRPRAIVVRRGKNDSLERRASLLRYDSVHGSFDGTIREDEENHSLVINGNEVRLIYADRPDGLDYKEHGIDEAIIVDNTGVWRDREGLSRHLKSPGAAKVLLTAPGKGDIKNIVHGINEAEIKPDDTIVSAASCTTNAIAVPLKVVSDEFGIDNGHLETVHAYTNDQNLIDNFHKAERRGRSAALNMVITETGAATAVGKVLPELAGRLSGNAIRVPTPNVSLAILHLRLQKAATAQELNDFLRDVALHSPLRRQLGFQNSTELVSSDFIGSRQACVLDSAATRVNGKNCILYLWYDNEFGYARQVFRVLQSMGGVRYEVYPRNGK